MRAVVSMICGVAARACLAKCLHVSSSCYDYSFSCCVDLCGSLPWMEHCSSHHNLFAVCLLIWAMWIAASLAYFATSAPSPSHPSQEVVHGRYQVSSFSVSVLVGGHLQDWFPLTVLPWNLPAEPGIFTGTTPIFDSASSQAHQLAMNFKKDKIKWPNFCSCNTYNCKKPFICTFCFRKLTFDQLVFHCYSIPLRHRTLINYLLVQMADLLGHKPTLKQD